jgi:hypothetical protein
MLCVALLVPLVPFPAFLFRFLAPGPGIVEVGKQEMPDNLGDYGTGLLREG